MANTCNDIQDINDFLASNTNIIEGKIIESLSIQSPWLNVFETNAFPAHKGDVLRTVVQEPIAPVLSECNPTWGAFTCRTTPSELTYGQTDYQYQLERTWERGQPICIADAYTAVEDNLRNIEDSFEKHTATVWNAWIRARAFRDSATKIVANSTVSSFEQLVSQGFQTNFAPGIQPDSPLSWCFLEQVMDFATQELLAQGYMYGSGVDEHARLITDMATAHLLRNDPAVAADLRAGVQGSFRDKYDELFGYPWVGPYRGIGIGVDQTILRANTVNANGSIVCVEPRVAQAVTRGTKAISSPFWRAATFQVSFLVFKGAFERRIPNTSYTGAGMTKFDKQFWGGDVFWINNKDNDCNILGDWGYHAAVYAAAWKPRRPEFVIPILHLRCTPASCLTPCSGQYYIAASV